LQEATLEAPGSIRPFDRITVTGSRAGNNGNYRIRARLDDNRVLLRRKGTAVESGLHAVARHGDGCGLVAGNTCAELADGATLRGELVLPNGLEQLGLSLFYRAFAPEKLGTRDVPESTLHLTVEYAGKDGKPQIRHIGRTCSFQWRKAVAVIPLEPGVRHAVLTIAAEPGAVLQITGVYAGPPIPAP
jgi:hypothetical protein